MSIAIIGFGREGQSVFKFLKKRRGTLENLEIWILDKNKNIKVPAGTKKQLGSFYLKNLEKFDVIYRSPGVPYGLPQIKKPRKKGVIISSATKIFFNLCPAPIVGVTGTKGKGTTATLIYKILRAAHRPVFLAGNIGRSPLELLPKLNKKSLVVLELSSFQLQDLEKSPHIAVVLDVFPDHQDAHHSLREYYEAKANITRHQKPNDKIFYFKNSRLSRRMAWKSRGRKIPVDPSTWLRAGDKKFALFKPEELTIKGFHNFKNAVMAATVAKNLGVPSKIIRKAVLNFRGTKHRLELVRKIILPVRQAQGKNKSAIYFYNDSASTNPQTAAAAVQAFPNQPKILIAGGYDKGLNYKPLAAALKNSNTKLVVLFGQNKKKIARAIRNSGVQIQFSGRLKSAVQTAYRLAKSYILNSKSCVVLFSPGAASFDMFKNYADRGEQFKKIVKKLK